MNAINFRTRTSLVDALAYRDSEVSRRQRLVTIAEVVQRRNTLSEPKLLSFDEELIEFFHNEDELEYVLPEDSNQIGFIDYEDAIEEAIATNGM